MWTLTCALKLIEVVQDFLQWGNLKGFSPVNSYMWFQIDGSSTRLAAMRTLERFLSCMNSWVLPKLWWWRIGLLTQWACKWFLTCMNSYVCLKIFWISEGFLTHWPLKWFFPCVTPWVFSEIRRITIGLLTQCTAKWLLPCMNPCVQTQRWWSTKCIST